MWFACCFSPKIDFMNYMIYDDNQSFNGKTTKNELQVSEKSIRCIRRIALAYSSYLGCYEIKTCSLYVNQFSTEFASSSKNFITFYLLSIRLFLAPTFAVNLFSSMWNRKDEFSPVRIHFNQHLHWISHKPKCLFICTYNSLCDFTGRINQLITWFSVRFICTVITVQEIFMFIFQNGRAALNLELNEPLMKSGQKSK